MFVVTASAVTFSRRDNVFNRIAGGAIRLGGRACSLRLGRPRFDSFGNGLGRSLSGLGLGREDRRQRRRRWLRAHSGDIGFASLLLDLPDAVFQLQAMGGDITGRQGRIDSAQLADQSRPRLLINGAPCSPVVFWQSLYSPTQKLFVVRHSLRSLNFGLSCSQKTS